MQTINITIPVFNEEVRLARCIPKLQAFLSMNRFFLTAKNAENAEKKRQKTAAVQDVQDAGATGDNLSQVHGQDAHLEGILRPSAQFPYGFEIVIVNNASTDRTQEIAEKLAREYSNVRVLWLPEKGRGGALKKSWLESNADVLTYMDVDLSTDLKAFLPLVQSILCPCGRPMGFDLAIGSRLLPGAETKRGWKRELISRSYAGMVKLLFHAGFSDAQCGFKAISQKAARHLLPLVEDTGWFFDTELLLLAGKLGYRIFEIPVHWEDDSDSRVKIFPTMLEDLKGLIRLRRNFSKLTKNQGFF